MHLLFGMLKLTFKELIELSSKSNDEIIQIHGYNDWLLHSVRVIREAIDDGYIKIEKE